MIRPAEFEEASLQHHKVQTMVDELNKMLSGETGAVHMQFLCGGAVRLDQAEVGD